MRNFCVIWKSTKNLLTPPPSPPRVDEAILYTMDELDQALDKEDVKMVSINVAGIEKEYGLYGLPLLIHFNGNIPRVFDGQTLFCLCHISDKFDQIDTDYLLTLMFQLIETNIIF